MANAIDSLVSNPAGRIVFRTLRPLVHAVRRLKNPKIPNDQTVMRVSYGDKMFDIRHRRWNLADPDAIRQCFEQRQYDMPGGEHGAFVQRVYDEIVASGRQPLIVDCGANIGASILWFHARYPRAHIVGIEPAPANFELLQSNCAGLDVDLRQMGIGAEDGRAFLNDTGSDAAYRIGLTETDQSVEIVSVATILDSKQASLHVPFLLKLDIEGSEKNLFAGDCSAINRFPLIILEPHDWMFPGEGCTVEFFRFHAAAGREFSMHNENVASIAYKQAFSAPDSAETISVGMNQVG
ncbi:MAG TPA: FkbM family methyltransferase [Edaphobacter sp.]